MMGKVLKKSGFTLIEQLIVVTIFSISLIVLSIWYSNTSQTFTGAQRRVQSVQTLRLALTKMTDDIRCAKRILEIENTAGEKTLLTFVSDRFSEDEQRKYYFDKEKRRINLEVEGKTTLIASDVDKLEFKYYDPGGIETDNLLEIALIEIQVEARRRSRTPEGIKTILKAKVAPRNLRLR
jgi:prepilin-type N-terminal cleavage/methylation domain-containing protein